MPSNGDSSKGFADEPVNGSPSAPDQLGRTAFAQIASDAIRPLSEQRGSTVIGLVGSWGSGKTSLIRLVRGKLEQQTTSLEVSAAGVEHRDDQWKVLEFNPWFFQDLPSLQWGFLSALFDAVASEKDKRAKKVRSAIRTFGRAIAPAGAAGSLAGFDMSGIIRGAADLIGPDQSVSRQQASLEAQLSLKPRPVLIVLDDLERLSPDELLLVFKLIRLVGRLPYVHYLIAYDEETLLDVLRRTGLVGKSEPYRAGAYLEKMIQLRLDVPPLRDIQVDSLIDASLDQMVRSIGLQMDRAEQSDFAAAWDLHMRSQMTTPRTIKRYVAQVEALFSSLSSEVDPVDFLLLTWVKVVAPSLFTALPIERTILTGAGGSLLRSLSNHHQKPADLRARWLKLIKRSMIVRDAEESVAGVLGRLFPRFRAIHEGSSSFPGETTAPRKISNPDYFDRYFALEVPAGDIPDSVVEMAYRAIITNNSSEERTRVEAALLDSTRLVVRKLESRFDIGKRADDARALLMWLATKTHQIPDPIDLFTPRNQAEGLCFRLFTQLDPTTETLVTTMDELASVPDGIALLSLIVSGVRSHAFFGSPQEVEKREAAYKVVAEHFGEMVANAFTEKRDIPPLELDDTTWGRIWDWRVIDLSSAQEWLKEQFASGRWTRLDTAARLVGSRTPLGMDKPSWTLSDLDLSALDDLVGIDELIAECATLPALRDNEQVREGARATPESRRNYVRTVVGDLNSGRASKPVRP